MMAPQEIDYQNNKAAREAEANGTEPYFIDDEELEQLRESGIPSLPIPFLGDYVPPGWERTGVDYFVDSSGFGGPTEPALTIHQFTNRIESGFGYAVVSAGQFQVYVDQYRRED